MVQSYGKPFVLEHLTYEMVRMRFSKGSPYSELIFVPLEVSLEVRTVKERGDNFFL